MHRLIMLSRTYRLMAPLSTDALTKDPTNEFLTGFPRRRLDAETIRDTLLVLGGNLDLTPAGTHPFPPEKDWKFTQHNPFKAVYETNRRSVYLMTQRIQRHPFLALFDGADPSASTPARPTSTTPVQALYLLNDPFVHEQTKRLAARLLKEASDDQSRLQRASELLFARPFSADETAAGVQYLAAIKPKLSELGTPSDQVDQNAWSSYLRALIRLNEFVYLD